MQARTPYKWLSAVVSAGVVLCLFSSGAQACHCVAPNKNSKYVCDNYCTTSEIRDLLGANIRQGYIIDGEESGVKRQGDVASEAVREKGVDAECLRAGGNDFTCRQEASAQSSFISAPSNLKTPQQVTMIGKNRDSRHDAGNRHNNGGDDNFVPIGHSDNAYQWPAGFEPAAGGDSAQCEGGIAIAPGDAIEYYGDSTVYGLAGAGGARIPKPATDSFSEALDGQYIVRNEGVSDTTACQLLTGSDAKHPAWDAQMQKSNAKVVIINFALSDQYKIDNVEIYSQCLRDLSRIAKENGKQVIFETPNPDVNPERLSIYVDAMKTVAEDEKVPLIDQYKFLNDYLAGSDVQTILADKQHPSEAVYDMKGKFAASVFGELTAGCNN